MRAEYSWGYYLTKSPCDISVFDVLSALDCGFEFTDCASGKCSDEYCPNKLIFARIYRSVDDIVKNTSLEDMINDYKCEK